MSSIKFHFYPINSPGIIAAKMWVREGSRADPINQKGIHNLLGSLLSRGCGPYSNTKVDDLVEGNGASLQCETYEDGLLLSLKCIEDDIYKLLPILGWMIMSPHLETKHINLEKDLTIKALKRQKENPFYLAFDGWRNLAYREGPYNHDPLGSIQDLETIKKNTIESLSKKLVTREKTLVIAGSLPSDLKSVTNEIEPFAMLLNTTKETISNKQEQYCSVSITTPSKRISLQFQETSQVVIMLGKATIPYNNIDDTLLRLLSFYLGSGMSSKLFVKLREENGVAYDVGIYHPRRESATPFVIHASTSIRKADFTLRLLREEWRNLFEKSISLEDLSLAKAKFQGQIAHSSQTVGQRAERKAYLLGQHLSETYETKILNKLKLITSEELRFAAQKHLQEPMLSLCGPKKILMKLSENWKSQSE